jgi:D-glycero-D-manno-heptose 1,7-bisphosphate phosphatase
VFLDRDGVINEDVFYPESNEWEAPLHPDHLVLRPGVMAALLRLQSLGCALVLVSNQAAYAKGKVALTELMAVHDRLLEWLTASGVEFSEFCYSYTHPEGIVPGFSGPSLARKPGIYFLVTSAARHGIDLSRSWMVGDRDTDIMCGKAAGARTVLVANPRAGTKAGRFPADFYAESLPQAVDIVVEHYADGATTS